MSEDWLMSMDVAFTCVPDCLTCFGTGHVCEGHPDTVWDDGDGLGCDCGAAGMPCPQIIKRHA